MPPGALLFVAMVGLGAGVVSIRYGVEWAAAVCSPRTHERNPTRTAGTFHFNTMEEHPIGGLVTMLSPCSLLSAQKQASNKRCR